MKDLVLVHSYQYRNWVFSTTHPTQGRRFDLGREKILAACAREGIVVQEVQPRLATLSELETVHSPAYVSRVVEEGKCEQWESTRIDLGELAATFVGGTLVALDALRAGETLTAVNLPGAKHHAQFDRSSGFCVFADLVIAAKTLTRDGHRVAIFDFDAHHGDGTENLSAEDPNILTYSVHQSGIFPFTGEKSDHSRQIFNLPLRAGHGDDELLGAVHDFIARAKEFRADYIFLAAGADGHVTDPLANLEYTTTGTRRALEKLREAFPTTPILMGGAGGYQPDDETPNMWCAAAMGLVTSGKSSRV